MQPIKKTLGYSFYVISLIIYNIFLPFSKLTMRNKITIAGSLYRLSYIAMFIGFESLFLKLLIN